MWKWRASLCLALAACTPQPPQVAAPAGTSFPEAKSGPLFAASALSPASTATRWQFDRCGYAVTFSGIPKENLADEAKRGSFQSVDSYDFAASAGSETTRCMARTGVDFRSLDETALVKELMSGQGIVYEHAVYRGPDGSTVIDMLGSVSQRQGTEMTAVRIFANQSSIFMLGYTALVSKYDPQTAFRFVNSLAPRAGSPDPATMAAPEGVLLSIGDVDKLRLLKERLEQKQITPAEYDAQRRAIIEGI